MTETNTNWVDGLTIGEVLTKTAKKFPDREALVFAQNRLRMNYSDFLAAARNVSKGLLAMGIKPGEHVGIWATNLPEWTLLQYGAANVGIVLVTINPAYRSSELGYTIKQSDIVALFLTDKFKSSDYYSILAETCPDLPQSLSNNRSPDNFPKLRYVVGLKPNSPKEYMGWEVVMNLAKNITDKDLDAVSAKIKSTDVVNIQYTSGTTGFPKAAMLTHRNILMNAWYVTASQQITEKDRMCVPVPFYHCFGCVMGSLGAVTRRATMVVPAEHFSPSATLDTIEKEHCTTIYGVPTMFIAMLAEPSFKKQGYPSLRSGIMAGSPCPTEVMKKVIEDMGCREITIAYGQTETSPVITQSQTDDSIEVRVDTVGKEIPGVEVKIINSETGEKLLGNQQGELCARGHGTMVGYYNNPEATKITIDEEGWVHTGDLAIQRSDGCYKITGRLKDMVIRGGENVYPREIEEFLFTHPAISQVSVFGVPDVKFGEELCVWIQLREGSIATEEDILVFCKKKLAQYKVPKYIKFVTEFPTTVSGKIQKFKMREQMCAELGLKEIKTA